MWLLITPALTYFTYILTFPLHLFQMLMKLLWEKRMRNTNTFYSDKNQCKSQGIKGIYIVLIELVGYCSLGEKWFSNIVPSNHLYSTYLCLWVDMDSLMYILYMMPLSFREKTSCWLEKRSLLIVSRQICMCAEEAESEPLPCLPPGHVQYFELKGIESQQIQRAITRDNYLNDVSVWQDKNLITKFLFFLLSCELPPLPWKPQAPILFLSLGWHVSLNC